MPTFQRSDTFGENGPGGAPDDSLQDDTPRQVQRHRRSSRSGAFWFILRQESIVAPGNSIPQAKIQKGGGAEVYHVT